MLKEEKGGLTLCSSQVKSQSSSKALPRETSLCHAAQGPLGGMRFLSRSRDRRVRREFFHSIFLMLRMILGREIRSQARLNADDDRYAEMDKSEKNRISHRGKALDKLKAWLREEVDA